MKKVLYIGSGAPWVGGAGYLVRQRMFLRALAGTADLTLALFDLPSDAPSPPFDCKVVGLKLAAHSSRSKISAAWADLTNPLPRMVRDVDLAATRYRGESLESFDAVFAYRVDFAHFAGVLKHPNLLLDVDDPEHIRWRRRAESSQKSMDWRTERDLQKLRHFEVNAVRGAAHAFVCQEHDRASFPSDNVTVVPNGVEIPPSAAPRITPPTLLFLGNFAAGPGSPNYDALEWFTSSIWPLVHAQCPNAECHIVGRLDAAFQSKLGALPNMRAVGFVANLADAFSSSRLSVAPLRFGTGTRIKILDSFAHACPVVSTTAGADGLDVTPSKNILIADDPATFAEHCARLLNDEALAQTIGNEGYRLVSEKYNTLTIQSDLRRFLEDFVR